jgi:plastocyanin
MQRVLLVAGFLLLALASGPVRAAATVRVTISGVAFGDVKQPVVVGDVIEWINRDVIEHTATAKNGDWRVVIPAGATVRLVLKKAGTVDYFCEYHPNMTGRLVIRAQETR